MIDMSAIFTAWAAKLGLDAAYKYIIKWFNGGKERGILIIGPGGVGKTTLACFLSGKGIEEHLAKDYEESISVEKFDLFGKSSVQVIVPPGQSHRRASTWENLIKEITDGKIRGIITIVAHGHHSIGDISYKDHKLYSKGLKLDEFVELHLEECRVHEESILKIVSQSISRCDKPIWLMVLVTKQDLWWTQRSEVEKYYASGPYKLLANECLGRKAEKDFRHETVFISLVLRNLMTGRNELLKKTAAGYDEFEQQRSFKRLVQVFEGLMKWEQDHG